MASETTWWLAAGAAVVGAGVLLLRRRAAAADGGADDCDKLAPLGAQAVAACKAARGLFGVLDKLSTTCYEAAAQNRALNGEPVPLHPSLRAQAKMFAFGGAGGGQWVDAVAPPARYRNGCVAIPGHPDWGKCAPGTVSQVCDKAGHGPGLNDSGFGERARVAALRAYTGARSAGSRTSLDPYTRKHEASPAQGRPSGPFPLTVPAGGSAWWDRGEPRVCPAGQTLAGSEDDKGDIDHREGAPRCVSTSSSSGGGWWQDFWPTNPRDNRT